VIRANSQQPILHVLYTETKTYHGQNITCPGLLSTQMDLVEMTIIQEPTGYTAPTGAMILKTNIAGVGYAIDEPGGTPWKIYTAASSNTGAFQYTFDGSGRPHQPSARSLRITYYKIGSIASGGRLTRPTDATTATANDIFPFAVYFLFNRGGGGGGEVIVETPTCDISVGDVAKSVQLKAARPADFDNAFGVSDEPFTITVDRCQHAKSALFAFTGGTPDQDNPVIFKNVAVNGAQGVGIRLFTGVNDTIGANGTTNERRVTVTGNQAVLPVTAQYYKTGAVVGSGPVRSQVTLNMRYD
jgi:major type 1 subunit fimbrin (pilin)